MYQKTQEARLEPILITGVEQIALCNSWVEVNRQAIVHNIAQYKRIIGNRELAVVVKGNAYGHGMLHIARICEADVNVHWLCTASLSEALRLRENGITKSILVLTYIDDDLALAVAHDIEIVVYDIATLKTLQKHAEHLKKIMRVHVKVDTGLSRLGISPDAVLDLMRAAADLPNIKINGIFTHLSESEKSEAGFTQQQMAQFKAIKLRLAEQNVTIPYHHHSCTAALTAVSGAEYNFARMGLGIYGLWPSKANKAVTQQVYPDVFLRPVLTWKTRIVQVKPVSIGSAVGYARTYTTKRDSLLAILPIGYWEGYDRKLSNQGVVLVNGNYAPVVGRISMNVTIIDVTDVPGVAIGQEASLLGSDLQISAEAIAEKIGTINWEVVTRINPLLPRIVV